MYIYVYGTNITKVLTPTALGAHINQVANSTAAIEFNTTCDFVWEKITERRYAQAQATYKYPLDNCKQVLRDIWDENCKKKRKSCVFFSFFKLLSPPESLEEGQLAQ